MKGDVELNLVRKSHYKTIIIHILIPLPHAK
jgi:hypothetical protein